MEHIRTTRACLTPALASRLLEANSKNRIITQARVEQYADDMRASRWRYNPADTPIAIDWNGDMFQGQHRCWAVVLSGVSIEVDIVHGLDPALREVTDSGKERTAADLLRAKGESTAVLLAALAQWQLRHEAALESTEPYRLTPRVSWHKKASNAVVYDCIERHPRLRACVTAYSSLSPKRIISPSVAGWAYYQLSSIDTARADVFWALFSDGAGLETTHPVFALRRTLLNRMGHHSVSDYEMQIALIFKSWNYWLSYKPSSVLVWKDGLEAFPQPITPKAQKE